MKNKGLIRLTVLAFGLGGCALYASKYEEPYTGSIATLIFKTNAIGITEVTFFKDAAECSGTQDAGYFQRGQDKKVRVPADRELAAEMRFNIIQNNVQTYCGVMFSFTPAKGNVYQVTYNLTPDRRACSVGVTSLGVGGNESPEPVKGNRRVKRTSVFDANSAHCMPL
jgi:hypothetical protein